MRAKQAKRIIDTASKYITGGVYNAEKSERVRVIRKCIRANNLPVNEDQVKYTVECKNEVRVVFRDGTSQTFKKKTRRGNGIDAKALHIHSYNKYLRVKAEMSNMRWDRSLEKMGFSH